MSLEHLTSRQLSVPPTHSLTGLEAFPLVAEAVEVFGDGRLEISNNAAENQIRPLKLGAKNWLFAGSDAGGRRAALFYTLIRTAVLNGLEPEAYLRDVIARIASNPINRLAELLQSRTAPRSTQASRQSFARPPSYQPSDARGSPGVVD